MNEKSVLVINQYLTFSLGKEFYALDVSKVKEVLELVPITRVPKMPPFMKGVINLRGSVVPVIDLRIKFNMKQKENNQDTCIIVLEIKVDEELITLGAIADSVQEVIELNAENIEPAPKIGTKLNTDFINGMGKHQDKFLIILNIDKVFTTEELTDLAVQENSSESDD